MCMAFFLRDMTTSALMLSKWAAKAIGLPLDISILTASHKGMLPHPHQTRALEGFGEFLDHEGQRDRRPDTVPAVGDKSQN
jgi:hypothetical protein